LNRMGTIRPLASPLGSLGRPIFLGFGWGIGFELLDDCGAYRAKGRCYQAAMKYGNVALGVVWVICIMRPRIQLTGGGMAY
jgi:hypothetical protein